MNSMILYAAPVRPTTINVKRNIERIEEIQRQAAYRAISKLPPIDLLVKERLKIFQATAEDRKAIGIHTREEGW